MNEQRFITSYTQYTHGKTAVTEILVDKETGINYLFHINGLTPLLDSEGRPIKSVVDDISKV